MTTELLPPHLLERLAGLDVIARTVVDGFLAGAHRARWRGAGKEFDRHRAYQQGDEVRHVDWRLYARTDRVFVREYHDEASLAACIIVDATASMAYADAHGLTKLRYAKYLAAALAHLMLGAGDAVGLASYGTEPRLIAPPRSRRGHLHDLLLELERLHAGGNSAGASAVRRVGALLRRRGRVVLVSDLLEPDDGAELVAALGTLRARGDEVIVLRPLTPVEAGEAPLRRALFFDPEAPASRIPSGSAREEVYRARVRSYYERTEAALRERGIEYVPLLTTTPVEIALREWLRPRSARA